LAAALQPLNVPVRRDRLDSRRRLLRQGADTVKVSGHATKEAGQKTVPADVEQTGLTILVPKLKTNA